jgi:hypothetical protein
MHPVSRRAFLGASLLGAAAPSLLAAEPRRPAPKAGPDDPPFQPATLFLTWQRDPTTTMTVQWVGTVGETADTRVYYRPAEAALPAPAAAAAVVGLATGLGGLGTAAAGLSFWLTRAPVAKPYPGTDFKVFRAELTGLRPGTDYEFRIGKLSPVYRFRTMPAKATDAITFVSGGDCGVNAHAVANNVQAARQGPTFAVIGGDLGYDNGTSVEVSLAFLRNYSRTMVTPEGRLIPLVPCIGNHEVAGGYGKGRDKAPFFYALFDGLFRETGYAALDVGDYLSLVLLDTGHTSAIAGEQTAWLGKTLLDRQDRPHVLVVNHVPAYPSFRNPTGILGKLGTGEGNRTHWVPLFEKYRVPVVLEHHDHTFKRTKPLLDGRAENNGVLYLGDGSWGRIRPANSPDKLSYLAASGTDFHLSLHRLQGDERFHLALDETGRVMDAAHSGQRTKGLVRPYG